MDGDGGVRALAIMSNASLLNDFNKKYNELIPKLMEIDDEKMSSEYNRQLVDKIEKKYFDGHFLIRNDSESLMKLYNDRAFITPIYNMFNQFAQNDQTAEGYMYKFSFKGPLSYSFLYTGSFNDLEFRPVHADELIYLIKSPVLFPHQNFPETSEYGQFRKDFVEFFTHFATHG